MTNAQIAELVLRYLSVFLSWPPIILALGLLGMLLFRKPISNFLSRIERAKGYGVEVQVAPQADSLAVQKPEAPELAAVVEQQPSAPQEGPPMVPQAAIDFVRQNPGRVIEDYLRAFNGYRFEKAFNLIYGSQIRLLQHLAEKGAEGDLYTELAPFYEDHCKRLPTTPTQMADFVRYLEVSQFVEYRGAHNQPNFNVRITPMGLNFLSYIRTQYQHMHDKKPW